MPQYFQRAFWSLYGRFVWGIQEIWARQVQHVVTMLMARRTTAGERVLDAGCGTGEYAVALAKAGFRVTAIDYAKGMIACAQERASDEPVGTISFLQMDLNARLSFPNANFDHIINISVLQVTANPAFTLSEFWRVLKPGGTLVLLHVPKSQPHNLPLRKSVEYRIDNLETKALWKIPFIAAKVWAERTGSVRYWTAEELQQMLEASKFAVLAVEHGPPIVILAERPL